MRRPPGLRTVLILGLLASACTKAHPADDSGADAGIELHIDEQEPRHVLIRVPDHHMDRFPEGGGLVESVPPHRIGGESDWWIAFLPLNHVKQLARELDGVEWQIEQAQELLRAADGLRQLDHMDVTELYDDCTNDPREGDFCPYNHTIARCSKSLLTELNAIDNYSSAVEVLNLGTTEKLGLPIKAVRIGKATNENQPQMVFYAGQHAREWVSTEVAMELIRYFAESYRDGTNNVRTLLEGRALVIVPVSNPDGYEKSFTDDRKWRTNAVACNNSSNIGVDPNRNFGFGWGEEGSGDMCISYEDTYRGPQAESEKETAALEKVLANDGLPGSWITRLSVNVHAYGNTLMFPDGFSSGFSPCTTNTNCSSPDIGAFDKLVGTDVSPQIRTTFSDDPYAAGPLYRSLTFASGDSAAEHHYGSPSSAPNALAFSAELTHHSCGFYSEHMKHARLDELVSRWTDFVTKMVKKLPAIHDKSFYDNYAVPHLHRRSPDGKVSGAFVSGLAEYPTLRVSVNKSLNDPDVGVPGPDLNRDDVIDGVGYGLWRWRPDPDNDPYTFPGEIPLCADKGSVCRDIVLHGNTVDLCDGGRFNGGTGWSFQGNTSGGPQAECFWKFTALNQGTGTWLLDSGKWALGVMKDARLVYSIRRSGVTADVIVSDNGFSNCSTSNFGNCRIVRTYPRNEARDSIARLRGKYRTQVVDVSDFDGHSNVQVRFRVKGSSSTDDQFDVYDPLFIGWKDE